MTRNDWTAENLITVSKAAQLIGAKISILQYHIDRGAIESRDGCILKSAYEDVQKQKDTYIGIKEFLKQHDGGRFDSKYCRNRNKYIDYLEENNYFGVTIHEPEEMLFDLPEREDFYITKEDALFLDFESRQFFVEFGLTEKEKVTMCLNRSKGHPVSLEYMKKYLSFIEDEENIYTPSLTAFVRTIFDLPDIKQVTDEDAASAIGEADTVRTKELLADFFTYVSKYESVKYGNINLKKKESEGEPAYPYEDFVGLAKILFNIDYDTEHNLTINALENHLYAEMWMFLSCHYVCGWRSSDICNRWVYPGFKSSDNPFHVNIDTLKEDILNGYIAAETYDSIALYVIRKIEMSYNIPEKTGLGKLRSEMVPELRVFFGKLTLIAEYHHLTSGEGYMNVNRMSQYRNWIACREFFGDEVFAITGKHYISSRRLNKSYLQGMEQSTRENGHTALVAHVIASFARNHANINTTAVYLRDHGLSGETAEVVLYMMMQRGVFSVSLYNTLISAFPEAFEKLSAKEQTQIMKQIPLSAYELETAGTAFAASDRMMDVLSQGKTDEPTEILKAMFAVAQGNGKAKDTGVYCKKKALGMCCVNPTYESCLANLCPYHVFTSDGIPSLVKVIKDYKEKARITGNIKYEIALKTMIIPAFQDVINAIIKEMSEREKAGTRKLIEEALNG